jgi:hypothetical protein
MDSSLSSDLHAPDVSLDFRADRWRRAQATPEEISELAHSYADWTDEQRYSEAITIDAVSNGDMIDALERMRNAGEFTGYATAPAAPPTIEDEAGDDDGEDDGEVTGGFNAEEEAAAAHGDWKPAGSVVVDETEYPAYDLEGGWVGARIGEEDDGVHVMAPDHEALQEVIRGTLGQPAGSEQADAETGS